MNADMDWRAEAERLRRVAGRLQDENDRLHHDLAWHEEKAERAHAALVRAQAENDALRAVADFKSA